MNEIDLMLDEENELTFQLNIEGSRPAEASCRLNLQGDDLNLMFEAKKAGDGEVNVVLPPLSHILKEGKYDMSLEVIVDDKYFVPLELTGNFEKSVKVTAEAVVRTRKKTSAPKVTLVEKKSQKRKEVIKEVEKPIKPTISVKNSLGTKKREVSDSDILKIIEALSKRK